MAKSNLLRIKDIIPTYNHVSRHGHEFIEIHDQYKHDISDSLPKETRFRIRKALFELIRICGKKENGKFVKGKKYKDGNLVITYLIPIKTWRFFTSQVINYEPNRINIDAENVLVFE